MVRVVRVCVSVYVRPDRGQDIGRASGEGGATAASGAHETSVLWSTDAADATLSNVYCTSRRQGVRTPRSGSWC